MTFKVGDIVIPRSRQRLFELGFGNHEDYYEIEYTYTSGMIEKYAGTMFKIVSISGNIYSVRTLNGGGVDWTWSKDMFDLADQKTSNNNILNLDAL